MKTLKKLLRSPVTTVVLFLLAAGLLLTGTVGGTRAALTYYSENYTSRVQMYDIGVSLLENGRRISWRDYGAGADGSWSENVGVLLEDMLEPGEQLMPGRTYDEELSVTNSGSIDEYVRVTIYKYWVDASGEKLRTLSPDLIDLHLINLGRGWIEDTEASTAERTVLYYEDLLPVGETALPFADSLTIDASVASKVTQYTEEEGDYTVVTTVYDYDGVSFRLEVQVNAVQSHSAEEAVHSAWGRRVSVNGNRLSLD